MKVRLLFLAVLLISSATYAQKRLKNKNTVKIITLPNSPLTGVNTYSCNFDDSELNTNKSLINNIFHEKYVRGILNIQGYTYKNKGADISIILISKPINFDIQPEIKNISENPKIKNYKAIYSYTPDWEIMIEGKVEAYISLLNHKPIKIEIPEKLSFGRENVIITSKSSLEKILSKNKDNIDKILKNQILEKIGNIIKNTVKSELSYSSSFQEVVIKSLKSSKKINLSYLEAPYKKSIQLIEEYKDGVSPIVLKKKYQETISFWAQQIEENKTLDSKLNKKIIKVATNNIIQIQLLIDPTAITEQNMDLLKKADYLSSELKNQINDRKTRAKNNEKTNIDYAKLFKTPKLSSTQYEVNYTNSKNEIKRGILTLDNYYGMNPWENSYSFTIKELGAFNKQEGRSSSKINLKKQNILSYDLLGFTYQSVKYTDPTVVTIGGNRKFLEEMIIGEMSLFRNYNITTTGTMINYICRNIETMQKSRDNPEYIIKIGKKATLVYNYSKLASILKKYKTISEKIKSGEYGNTAIKARSSKFGKFLQQGVHNEIDANIITIITKEVNSL